MEHIVQFGINIDDDVIKKNIERNVQNQVVNIIKQDCMKELVGKKDCSNWEYTYKVDELISNTTKDFLESYKDEIIQKATNKLVEKLSKTKAVKDMVASTLDDLLK